MEIWKDIDGYNGKYQVSNLGNVRSFSKWSNGKVLKSGRTKGNPHPYKFVVLVNGSRKSKKNEYIHRLVAKSFVENPYGLTEVNHKDGNTLNNNVENLEWCTHSQNMIHASNTGVLCRGQDKWKGKLNPKSKPVLQFTKNGLLVKEWESVNQIMCKTGIPASSIFKCCNPEKYPHEKSAYGYIWRYKNGKTSYQEDSQT